MPHLRGQKAATSDIRCQQGQSAIAVGTVSYGRYRRTRASQTFVCFRGQGLEVQMVEQESALTVAAFAFLRLGFSLTLDESCRRLANTSCAVARIVAPASV